MSRDTDSTDGERRRASKRFGERGTDAPGMHVVGDEPLDVMVARIDERTLGNVRKFERIDDRFAHVTQELKRANDGIQDLTLKQVLGQERVEAVIKENHRLVIDAVNDEKIPRYWYPVIAGALLIIACAICVRVWIVYDRASPENADAIVRGSDAR